MKKTIALVMTFVFAVFAGTVSAEGVALTDAEMDEIAAGDWVVIEDGQEVVDGIHFNNNDIELTDTSQQLIQAVSNANIVDSAVAIQYNIASVEGGPTENVAVNGTNEATLANYNPSDELSSFTIDKTHHSIFNDFLAIYNESHEAHYEAAASASYVFDLDETLDTSETLDIAFAAASATEWRDKGEKHEDLSAAALVVDYDNVLDYDLTIDEFASASASESAWETWNYHATLSDTYIEDWWTEHEEGSFYRSNKSENNHIYLDDESQMNIVVVSNLNSVGSAAAVQQNIATNVGVSGTITHVNVANAINGL